MSRSNSLAIDAQHSWSDIAQPAMSVEALKGGIRRPALAEEDRHLRDRFKRQCEAAGRSVDIDPAGNMREMVSGAGHDAAYIAQMAPTR